MSALDVFTTWLLRAARFVPTGMSSNPILVNICTDSLIKPNDFARRLKIETRTPENCFSFCIQSNFCTSSLGRPVKLTDTLPRIFGIFMRSVTIFRIILIVAIRLKFQKQLLNSV